MMKALEFLFDYASPFAFLANELASRKLPGAEIVWQPVYLRALESFSDGFPFKAAKTQYMMRDLIRCSEHERVEMKAPATFPINGLYALRGALVAQKIGKFEAYHGAMFRAVWRESREIESAQSVADFARGLGLPEVADGIQDPAIKAELRAATDAAAKRGVFGVPTFFVNGDMFWGHDRMDYVARALATKQLIVPFNEHARVQFVRAEADACVARIPDAHELTNHLGTVHGGALFTVAEAASGRAFMEAARSQAASANWDPRSLRAVVRNAQIRYRKPARGVISAHARVVTPAHEWATVLEQQGKATANVLIEVRDAADVLVAEMDVEWHVARAP